MLEIGSVFENRFEIIKKIGDGGMSLVYQVRDLQSDTLYALKEAFITEENRSMLLSESDIMEKLSHPSFPRLIYKKESGASLYLVMEYIDGYTLEDIISAEKQIDEAIVVDWFIQIGEVLRYLHGLDTSIIHRDLKPSNIMLEKSGCIRIVDFGIAQEYQDQAAKVEIAALTRGYAAPEQYDSRYSLDVRTDIYALAVTMHYLLTGKNPNEPPYVFRPIKKLRHDVSFAIEHIVKKCLQPNPNKRYPNVELLLQDLKNIDLFENELTSRVRWKKILIGSVSALVITVSLIAYSLNYLTQQNKIQKYYYFLEQSEIADTLDESVQNVNKAIELSPDNPEAYIKYAEIMVKYDNLDDAIDYINNILIIKFPDIYEDHAFLILVQDIENHK